jgi:hypothetical protein
LDIPGSGGRFYHASTNADGLRTAHVQERDPSRIRVVAIGGSFSFGANVEDDQTWVAVLERKLNQERLFDSPVEIVNGAQAGFGNIVGSWQLYSCVLQAYQPDYLIFEAGALHPGEAYALPDADVIRQHSIDMYYVSPDGFLRAFPVYSPTARFFYQKSALFRAVQARIAITRANAAIRETATKQAQVVDAALFANQEDPALQPFRSIAEHLAPRHVSYAVLARIVNNDVPEAEASLCRRLEEMNVPCFNTRQIFPDPANMKYLTPDGHWSAFAHALVADFVYQQMKARLPEIAFAIEQARAAQGPR